MEVLYLLIPLVLIGILVALGFLFWAIKSGQYDDLEKEATRILLEDDNSAEKSAKTRSPTNSAPSSQYTEPED